MVKKKNSKKKKLSKKLVEKKKEKVPTLQLRTEHEIAMDFALKVHSKFDKIIKSIALFGSVAKQSSGPGSDIDIVIILDDIAIKWDQELIAWYREELEKILKRNPYQHSLHINTVKLSTWWQDLMRGDPVIINILRNGEVLTDFGGFFEPLKYLLIEGKIRPSPEAIYVSLQRAPMHLARSKMAQVNAIEGVYWAMVDSAHAALIAMNVLSPSPEHLAADLRTNLVSIGALKNKYVDWYREVLMIHKQIEHGHINNFKGLEIDKWQERTQEFIDVMVKLVKDIVERQSQQNQ